MRIAIYARVVEFSVADVTNAGLSTGIVIVATAPGLPLSVTLTDVCGGVDLTSPSIKRNLNIL